MKPVELVTTALWHFSVGDFARFQGTLSALAGQGLPLVPVSMSSGQHSCVVDSGAASVEMLRNMLGPVINCHNSQNKIVLNAISLGSQYEGDLSFFDKWQYLSVRDSVSASKIKEFVGQKIYEVPCPAMYVKPMPWESLYNNIQNSPSFDFCKMFKLGKYVVVDADDKLAAWADKVDSVIPVDTRPWQRRNWRGRHKQLPVTHSAEIIMTVVANAKAVVTRSLHLGILSLAAGTPFVFYDIDNRPDLFPASKSYAYWKRAGFEEIVYSGRDPIEYALSKKDKLLQIRAIEFSLLCKHVERIVEVCS